MKVVQNSAESSCRSFLRYFHSCRSFLLYFHSAISNHLSIAISLSTELLKTGLTVFCSIFQSQITLMDLPVFKSILPDVSNTSAVELLSRVTRNLSLGFLTRLDTNRTAGLYYPCSENKAADHLCSYGAADLYILSWKKFLFPIQEELVVSYWQTNGQYKILINCGRLA